MEFKYTVSTEKVNSKGYIIKTDGIDITQFVDNPVALYNHNSGKVIGSWKDIMVDEDDRSKLVATIVFDTDNSFASEIMNQVNKGLIKHASIGLELVDGYLNNEDIVVVTSCILKEISIVSLPANTEAIKLSDVGIANELTSSNLKEMRDTLLKLKEEVKTLTEQLAAKELPSTEPIAEAEVEVVEEVEAVEEVKVEEEVDEKDAKIVELTATVADLSSQLEAIANKEKELKFNSMLDEAVEAGKITDKAKATFLALSFDVASSIIEGLESKLIAPAVSLSAKVVTTGGEGKEDKDYRWYEKNDPEALKLMYENDRARHDKLEAEYYG